MKELHRARVVAIGSEEDMAAVCRTLLANCDWLEIPDDRPPYSLEELRQQVKQHAEELGGEESGFYYGMVARYTYGDADNRTCRLDIARQPSGLWTACFHYDGETPFQSEDWLYLHEHAGRVPMLAIHACADFAADKGMTVFTGGQTLDECVGWRKRCWGTVRTLICGLRTSKASCASGRRKIRHNRQSPRIP